MPLDLDALLELNRQMRADLDRRVAELDELEARLRRQLEGCENARRGFAVDRTALERSEEMHRSWLESHAVLRPAGGIAASKNDQISDSPKKSEPSPGQT